MDSATGRSAPQATRVSRERVVVPPPRHLDVTDEELTAYFKGVVGDSLAPAVPLVHQLIDGICTSDFSALRRRLQGDYDYFGAAADARSDVAVKSAEDLDDQELSFLSEFTQLMEASQFRMLTAAEWEAAQAEDFLFTLPCDVKWEAMDTQMLRRYWSAFPAGRGAVPAEAAERIMIFQRGAEVATMQGSYFLLKINLLISMWLLQPLYALLVWVMTKLKIRDRFLPDAPKGLAATADEDPVAKAAAEAAAQAKQHPYSTSIERRTFARVFPDGMSVVTQIHKKVKLQEACFKDVVVLYRAAVPDAPAPANEVDIIQEANPKFMQRNIVLKQFRGIPLADLEMVMPEKKIFVPPKVFVEMAVTLIGGLIAAFSTLKAGHKLGLDWGAAKTAITLFAGRAGQVYTSAMAQKMTIEHAMGKMLYNRTVGSGTVVLNGLVDSVCRQRVREIFVCYCVLLDSKAPLTAVELDQKCEGFLARQFGCKIDFCCEEALPAIMKWGLAAEGADGKLTAAPLPAALQKLDSVFDSLYDFKGSTKSILEGASAAASSAVGGAAAAGGAALGTVLSVARRPGPVTAASTSPAGGDKSGKGSSVFRRIRRALSMPGSVAQAAGAALGAALLGSDGGGGGDLVSAAAVYGGPARVLLQQNVTAATPIMDISVGGVLDEQMTELWILQCAFLVFFMQCGFALLEAGTVRLKNTKNILLKNVIDACVGTIAWWAVGYAFAFGACEENGFIGYHNFFTSDVPANPGLFWATWLFGWAFASTSSTIVSGAMAERTKFRAYLLYTMCISAFIYPCVAHWVWSSSGWLSAKRVTNCASGEFEPLISGTMGLLDFAGSGVVHMVGGGAALVGAVMLGPRLGRFSQDGHLVEFANSSPANMALGVFILWLGWYGFNAGSTQCFYGCMPIAAQVAVNTTLATGAGGLTCLFLAVFNGNPGDIGPLLNGILAGAVSITASCAMVQSYCAVIIGGIGALIYMSAARLLVRLRIDDPVDAAPVHFCCGAWGLLATGLFATKTSTEAAYGYAADWGVIYGGSGKQLGMQVLGIVVIGGWSCTLSALLFGLLKKLNWLRVPKDDELQGLDYAQGIGSGIRGGCFPCLPCCQS
ncbi:ammonium transporter [Micractinium conductrix]|uniref:Ammonium transporter n=1 Tax=Micractinium conductrix TaxID=554055 RepID=A0A2P6VIU4_9CHLO|nr:ammonium transporter [Micractinium conductrix]|eukprot:PSC73998.1 ammonium transporter [Micractinium conductrix]